MNTLTLHPLSGPVEASVDIPGSKSYTIRALLLAVLVDKKHDEKRDRQQDKKHHETQAGQPVRLWALLLSDDTLAMLRCLNTLGIRTEIGAGYIDVIGDISDIQPGSYELNADLSAASLRFLLALSAVIPGEQVLLGREGLNKRPVQPLVDSLRQMGANIEYLDREGYPPVRMKSSSLSACMAPTGEPQLINSEEKQTQQARSGGSGTIKIDGSISSQYISALLMIAPLVCRDADALTIEIQGELISRPYVDMTLAIMRDFGVVVHAKGTQSGENQPQDEQTGNGLKFIIPSGQAYQATEYKVEADAPGYQIEADASSAAYFAAIAALTGSTITLNNLHPASQQADMRFLQILAAMGNEISTQEKAIVVRGHGVQPLNVDMRDCPDQAQTLAVLAAFAEGVTRITGIQSLRVKETNRLEAVAYELGKMGIQTIVEEDALTIFGGTPQPATIDTYGDHRMAMAFAVAGSKLEGLRIQDPAVVSKTFPAFWEALLKLGIGVASSPAVDSRFHGIDHDTSRPTKSIHAQSGDKPDKLVLIGFMGSGKSLVAPLLGEKLDLRVVEMDRLVVARSGRASVKEIFERDGEARFRQLEQEVAEALRHETGVIISTGGGVVMNDSLMAALSESSVVIHLDATLETVLSRVTLDNGRPLLKTPVQAQALYALRLPLYRQYADISVATDCKAPSQIVDEILSALDQNAMTPENSLQSFVAGRPVQVSSPVSEDKQ